MRLLRPFQFRVTPRSLFGGRSGSHHCGDNRRGVERARWYRANMNEQPRPNASTDEHSLLPSVDDAMTILSGIKSAQASTAGLQYAVAMVEKVCQLTGPPTFLDDLRSEFAEQGIIEAVANHDTPAVFDWLVAGLSFQGIANTIAADYMARHGQATWAESTAIWLPVLRVRS
jgi:hypothetical protein